MLKMNELGFDDWVASHADVLLQEGQSIARVMTVDRGAFLVRNGTGETNAELAGKSRYLAESSADFPCVGDWVCIERTSRDRAVIHAVLPRKTILRRKRAGKTVDYQMIAANVDRAFIMQSCHYDFNIPRLDRYLVAVGEDHIDPVVVLSKTDLVTPEELNALIDRIREYGISAKILPVSNLNGDGLNAISNLLEPGHTFCLIGSSGVGKSTLANQLLGHDTLETKAVSVTGEGVHTTSRRQLFVLGNGAILIDTPGMRELGLLGTERGIEESFSDIHERALTCRFTDCSHTQEPGCAILAARDANELNDERYHSFLKLRKETQFHNLSYVEKREKNKDFGRFIKSARKRRKR